MRSTNTVMVLSILSLTTRPVAVRVRYFLQPWLVTCLLVQHRLDASNVATHLTQQMSLRQLTGALLHTQIELLLQQVQQLLVKLVDGLSRVIQL